MGTFKDFLNVQQSIRAEQIKDELVQIKSLQHQLLIAQNKEQAMKEYYLGARDMLVSMKKAVDKILPIKDPVARYFSIRHIHSVISDIEFAQKTLPDIQDKEYALDLINQITSVVERSRKEFGQNEQKQYDNLISKESALSHELNVQKNNIEKIRREILHPELLGVPLDGAIIFSFTVTLFFSGCFTSIAIQTDLKSNAPFYHGLIISVLGLVILYAYKQYRIKKKRLQLCALEKSYNQIETQKQQFDTELNKFLEKHPEYIEVRSENK